jgi:hypothetical protein
MIAAAPKTTRAKLPLLFKLFSDWFCANKWLIGNGRLFTIPHADRAFSGRELDAACPRAICRLVDPNGYLKG